MELKELEYIVTIAEEGGISKAAQKLYLAQSSLSQFLSRYESELDIKLFQRTGSGVRTTAAGEVFVRNARQMLQQFERMGREDGRRKASLTVSDFNVRAFEFYKKNGYYEVGMIPNALTDGIGEHLMLKDLC